MKNNKINEKIIGVVIEEGVSSLFFIFIKIINTYCKFVKNTISLSL